LNSPLRLQIPHPSLFSTLEKPFQLLEYTEALEHHSVNSRPISKPQVLGDPRVLQFLNITIVEENVHLDDSDPSMGTFHSTSAASGVEVR
jgi:hypothetical protein